jgi:hypothetical protein
MSDLQDRLRDAVTASVDGAQPSFDVMTAVRLRHRRRLRRLAAAGAAAVMLVAATAAVVAARHAQLGHQPLAAKTAKPGEPDMHVPVFPGGGRLLLADGGVLRWLYPDGRTAWIPGSFDGAAVSAGELLAWKYTGSGAGYYTMNLNGSQQRLILPAGHDPKLSVINARLSPDGSALAYIRQDVVSPAIVTDTLWVLNLATGRRADLGVISTSAFMWRDDATILTAAPGSKSLELVSAATGSRSTYLAVTDPVLVHAYEQARPGAGPPAYIGSDGMSGSGQSSRIAVWLAAASRQASGGAFPQAGTFTKPAEVVLAGAIPLVTYAPNTPQQLSLTWGPNGLVLLQTGAGDLPGSWNAYAATLQSSRPSKPLPYGMDGATFNPTGDVIALQDGEVVTFVPTPRPACESAAKCLTFQPANLLPRGTVQAWTP